MAAQGKDQNQEDARYKSRFLVQMTVVGLIVCILLIGGGIWLIAVKSSIPGTFSARGAVTHKGYLNGYGMIFLGAVCAVLLYYDSRGKFVKRKKKHHQ